MRHDSADDSEPPPSLQISTYNLPIPAEIFNQDRLEIFPADLDWDACQLPKLSFGGLFDECSALRAKYNFSGSICRISESTLTPRKAGFSLHTLCAIHSESTYIAEAQINSARSTSWGVMCDGPCIGGLGC